jgi:hypothetical protein
MPELPENYTGAEVKISSSEFKQYSDQLSDDWYFDGDVEIPDSFIEGTASEDEILEIANGDVTLVYQGNDSSKEETTIDLVSNFTQWRKAQTHQTFAISVKKENITLIKKILKEHGVEIE